MFMVKEEYVNTKNLLKIKIKSAKNFMWFFIVAAFMFLSSIVPTVISIFRDKNNIVIPHIITDYSTAFFFGMVIVYLISMFTYRQINGYLSVFPQTNNSRFITSQLLNYILSVVVSLTTLAMYLLNYGILALLSHFKGGVYFALNFDIGFIITGFLTYIVYSFLIIATFGFIGAVLRKWRIYAAAAFVVLSALMLTNLNWVIENFPKIFEFLTGEVVPVWFMLKGTALWLVIAAVSLVINRFTIYHKSHKKIKAGYIALICIVAVLIVTVILGIMLFNTTYTNNNGVALLEVNPYSESDFFAGYEEIRIDVSHLPKGSELNIKGKNIEFPNADGAYTYGNEKLCVNNAEELYNLQGDTIVLKYRFPSANRNGCDIFVYTSPKLSAYLDGETLHIEYTLENENAHVIIMPIWGLAGQFDCYKDKKLLTGVPWGYSSGGGGNGNVFIRVE